MRPSIVLLAALLAGSADAATYKLDPEHTSVMFRVRHLVGHVTGQFTKFDGTFDYDPKNPKAWKASATIDAASVDTKTAQRDKHLRSEDFFNVEKYPKLSFVSTKVTAVKGNRTKLLGKLTILDTTKPIALDLEIGGVAKDSGGNERAAFTATGRIDRKDFGLIWNDTLETGGVLVGDDVDITIEVEGIRQK
ncbi:MAG: YceI family protein [Elusimicrobia bacterium]|nr:YceI family protein [Elusimicrobiota bacterium]